MCQNHMGVGNLRDRNGGTGFIVLIAIFLHAVIEVTTRLQRSLSSVMGIEKCDSR
jgi:hypothetical protein